MPLAHAAHDALVAGPAALGLALVALLTWSSARRARRRGPASMREPLP